jgi:superfamily I DNA/RNA helicase
LNRSLEEWRVFLHPSQRSIVFNNAKGPMKITGTAGTGKTVALLHRAVHLAQNLKENGSNDEGVLLLTFTMNLAYNLNEQIKQLAPDVATKITVTHLYGFARTLCQRTDWRGVVKFPDELYEYWEPVTVTERLAKHNLSLATLKQEFERIIDPLGITTEEEYLTAVRSGVPRLSRAQRKAVWDVMLGFMDTLRTRGDVLTPNGTVRQAHLALERLQGQGGDQRKQILSMRYPHVLVDEVQDLSLVALRFLTALPTSLSTPNCLTLAGDGHQRLYRHKVSLRRVGIEVQGRSRRLKINYRTTDEIRKWSQAVLQNQVIDDLDDNIADTRGDRSVMHGPKPEIVTVTDKGQATKIIGDWVQRLHDEHHIEYYAMCVVSNDDVLISHLTERKIPCCRIRAKEPDYGSKEPGVRIGSVERIKGLEFRAVCLTGVTQIADGDTDALHERSKWYVAATRAREYLLVVEG